MKTQVGRLERLALDIDTRLASLWTEAFEVEEWTLEAVAVFMRAAYGAGYVGALTEDVRGRLCRENGYEVPAPREATA